MKTENQGQILAVERILNDKPQSAKKNFIKT